MLKIKYHSKFKKDIKTIKKRNYDLSKLQKVIEILAEEKTLPNASVKPLNLFMGI
ncbi:type II toxin-antitoxin system mRNA interferase toxin, RelE/StbE family [Megamonas rupellensis]|uniref:type II toxin-antitoxin system mRNA interferase toxin, RelE/StbE family n=1 Tax=Megamonas rupellensis TaxID=491921 RepID=UPI00241F4B3F|nr:type II toxin-antitoxin system mRNA interferase toxin, RelE/StbE family [Megamonas rupellensis]